MPLAAKVGDPVQHTQKLTFLVEGLLVGVAVGVVAVATGGVGLVVGAAILGASACAGAGVGELIGSLDHVDDNLDGITTGHVSCGSPNVFIHSRDAARATWDAVQCKGTPPIFLPSHDDDRIAQGSGTVFINGQPAARAGDKIECGAHIEVGVEPGEVIIGGPTVTTLEIDDEVPLWVHDLLLVVGVASGVVLAGPIAALFGLVGSIGGGAGAGWLGGKLFGEGSDGQKLMAFAGSWVGGALGAKLGTTGRLASVNQAIKCRWGLEPVDLGSGRVGDDAVDLALPGAIPFTWTRTYDSSRAHERGALGLGGWTHGLAQWVAREPGRTVLRDQEGRDVYFPVIEVGRSVLHRSDRLVLTALEDGAFEVTSLDTRLTRAFAPLAAGGRAVLMAIRDAHGNAITLAYTGDELSSLRDTAGRTVRVKRDRGARVVGLEVWVDEELAQTVGYAYTARGELSAVTDACGHVERYAYDDQHRMVEKTLTNGVRFFYAYDERTGWCCRSWGDEGLHTGDIRVDLEKRITYLTGNDEPRVLHWNEDGLVVREETPDGILIGTWAYDADLYLVAQGNGAGETTRYEYDARGNKVLEIDPAGNVTRWIHEDDLPSRRIDPDGLETRFSHDARGSLRGLAHPSGVRYALAYDDRGRLASVEGDEGLLAAFAYDARHDVVEERDARGARTTYTYDGLGNPVSQTDALGRTTAVAYDRAGRPVRVEQPDGAVTETAYDARGRPVGVIDALGQTIAMEYSGTGVLRRVTQPDGQAWTFKHTASEKLRRVTNPRGEEHHLVHDTAGRLVEETTFDGRVLRYRYAPTGGLARIDYPDGSFRAFAYDALGNVVEDRTPEDVVTFPRDRTGRLLGAVLERGAERVVTRFEHDALGRVAAETHGDLRIRYEHDAWDRRVGRVLPDGATTRYAYDALDALTAVDHDGQRLVFMRDRLGRETARSDAGGRFSIQRAYDAMDRLVEQRAGRSPGDAPAVERRLRYDALGRVQAIEDGRWGATTYRYDAVGQLVEARRRARREVFAYDPAGAVRKMLEGLDARLASARKDPWEIGPGNVLLRTDEAAYTYDARGRRVAEEALDGASRARTTYHWDSRDRLREVRLPSGRRVTFTYDGFGRRVRKEVFDDGAQSAYRVDFLWDGNVLAAEIDSRRGTRSFVHAPGTFEPLLQAERGRVWSYVTDHLGTPRELLDGDGQVAWSASTTAWGAVTDARPTGPAVDSPFRLLGQYADEETGLACTWFRYFDPRVARWCSPDPIGLWGGPDPFGFGATPSIATDPLGLMPFYRGGNSLTPKPGEYRVRNGLVQTTHGPSLFSNPAKTEKWGTHEVTKVPDGLKIIQRGKDPEHHEIVPKEPMPEQEYLSKLNETELEKWTGTC